MILQRKADYDAAIKAATTARSVADSLEIYSDEKLGLLWSSIRYFKEDFDKVCKTAVWKTDFLDQYSPEEQWEAMVAEIQYAEHKAQCNSIKEIKIARVSCYVNMMTYWLSKVTKEQPEFYMFGKQEYELQINTSEVAEWTEGDEYIDCHDIPCDEVIYNEKEM